MGKATQNLQKPGVASPENRHNDKIYCAIGPQRLKCHPYSVSDATATKNGPRSSPEQKITSDGVVFTQRSDSYAALELLNISTFSGTSSLTSWRNYSKLTTPPACYGVEESMVEATPVLRDQMDPGKTSFNPQDEGLPRKMSALSRRGATDIPEFDTISTMRKRSTKARSSRRSSRGSSDLKKCEKPGNSMPVRVSLPTSTEAIFIPLSETEDENSLAVSPKQTVVSASPTQELNSLGKDDAPTSPSRESSAPSPPRVALPPPGQRGIAAKKKGIARPVKKKDPMVELKRKCFIQRKPKKPKKVPEKQESYDSVSEGPDEEARKVADDEARKVADEKARKLSDGENRNAWSELVKAQRALKSVASRKGASRKSGLREESCLDN